ncbi:Protein farnesyltransferase subunit beta [Ceratocystis fimbriata CBS 114723]|uniref:Protein farnesyltransferase subunit beta n=1 Tax=Ceratocystis fimbriata CBS 114723 TaxID=1035309 RepID=A0A2C5XJS8_9PEZI|nr:Protein farnesyltransferase subunit beta [Ceratocystis fimbriata CBS 114723]
MLATRTSEQQEETLQALMPYLAADLSNKFNYNKHGIASLERPRLAIFLKRILSGLPSPYYAADASRPWFLYWCLGALALLGEDVSEYRDGMVKTARYLQNRTGGFGGGLGHLSHLATTYAMVLSLVIVGGQEAYEVIDRKAMWEWLSLLKQEDGGFQMAQGGEVDVRGAYCATVLISLLGLPLDLAPISPLKSKVDASFNLHTKLGDYVRRCKVAHTHLLPHPQPPTNSSLGQTYEGGISGKPDAEAHGAYAFCALGCLSILDAPYRSIPKHLDVPRLIAWLSARQNAPEGGLSGRTNKLVDGCYSHWAGGCWPLLEAVLNGPMHKNSSSSSATLTASASASSGRPQVPAAASSATASTTDASPASAASRYNSAEEPFVESIMSREGLIRYILCCCQDESLRAGGSGMRDKPGKPSDAYHTLYVLSGLSSAQHSWNLYYDPVTADYTKWEASPYKFTGEQIFDEDSRVNTSHPVYVLPPAKVDDVIGYFSKKQGF